MKEYVLVSEETMVELVKEVDEFIEDGCELQGGVCVVMTQGGLRYYQALVREKT